MSEERVELQPRLPHLHRLGKLTSETALLSRNLLLKIAAILEIYFQNLRAR
jgi:hypothetical protein